jgi:AcrR family transcriptional regulator
MTSLNTKERIILASHTLFTRFGYSKTTMEDIGNEVGLNQASLYHHFRNGKEEIFLNVILNQVSKLREAFQAALQDAKGLERKLVVSYTAKFKFLKEDTLMSQVINLDFKKLPPDTKKRMQEVMQEIRSIEEKLVVAILQEAIDNKEIPKIDTQKTAQVIIQLTEGIRFTQLRDLMLSDREQSMKKIQEQLELSFSLLINGMK